MKEEVIVAKLKLKTPQTSQKPPQHKQSGKTEAEIQFEKVQRRKIIEKVKNKLKMPHRVKMEKFNNYLGRLNTNFEIPKPGKY